MDSILNMHRDGAVAILEIQHPPLNLLTMQLRSLLHAAALDIAASPDIHAVVIRSADKRVFSAGSDVREFPVEASDGAIRSAQEHACFNAIARMPQPILAQLSGHVLGGGLELALACDIRIADDTVRMALPEAGLGVFPTGGGTQRLPRLVGPSTAKLMMFLGETMDAADALRIGLVDKVVPAGEAGDVTISLARRIASRSKGAVQAIKTAINHGLDFGFSAGESKEEELAILFASPDAKEGVQVFLESRRHKSAIQNSVK
jgi:enoyl-CoA hydratase